MVDGGLLREIYIKKSKLTQKYVESLQIVNPGYKFDLQGVSHHIR